MRKRMVFVGMIATWILAACAPAFGAGSDGDIAVGVPSFEEPAAEAPADFVGRVDAGGGFGDEVAEAASAERLVIKNASLSLVVDDPEASMMEIAALAERLGGFVVSSNLYKSTTSTGLEVPRANITIRVPAERFQETLDTLREQSIDVLSDNQSGEDVTAAFTDLQSRLRNLEDAEALLRQIMEDADSTEDVLNAFNQLNYITEQIEVLKGQIQYYEESAALSAISIDLVANEAVQPIQIGPWTPVGAAKDAIEALIRALQGIVEAAIWLLLYVVPVVVVIGVPLWLIGRGVSRLVANRRSKPKSTSKR
ncbi:MAG: DUF4349 domain-containing protein [Anaerolineales bacterium]